MSDITLKVKNIKDGMVYFVQTNNGKSKFVGSARSPFLKDFKLVKDATVILSFRKPSGNKLKKKKVSRKKAKTTRKKR